MAVWLRRMASRRSTSIAAVASWPSVISPVDDLDDVPVQPGQAVDGVEHAGLAGVGADRAGVAHLPARLGVEGRAVEHDGVADHGQHPRLGLELLAARRTRSGRAPRARSGSRRSARPWPPSCCGPWPGRCWAAIWASNSVEVDGVAALVGDLLGDLDREPVGVVQREGHRARQRGAVAAARRTRGRGCRARRRACAGSPPPRVPARRAPWCGCAPDRGRPRP